MTRPARLVAACAVAALALTGCGSPLRAGAAAVIGSSRISIEQLAKTVDEGLADPGAAELASDRPAYQRDVLGRLISADVVEVAAQRQGVSVTPADVDSQYTALEQSVGGPEQLRQQAAAAGLTLARVRDLARTRALTVALGDKLTAGIPVSPEQLQQAYTAGLDTFDQVHTAQIQLATLADAQALLPEAATLSDQAFEDLARTRSLDETTKANGGDLGFAPRSAFAANDLEEYAAAAFAAKVGDTFAVGSPRGGHVVRVLGRRTATLEQATAQLRRTILREQRDVAVQTLLADTAKSLDITINPRFGAWDTETLSVVERTTTGSHEVSSPAAPATGPEPPAEGLLPSPGS